MVLGCGTMTISLNLGYSDLAVDFALLHLRCARGVSSCVLFRLFGKLRFPKEMSTPSTTIESTIFTRSRPILGIE